MSYQSGMDAFKAGNYQEAADAFRECVESDEDNHKAWNSLGVVYTKTGHYEAADTCYENALSLAPGTAAYERNRDKNKAKMMEPVEDVLNVEDDEPKDWKIPGPEDKPKPAAKPTSSAKITKTTPQYSIKQYAIAGIALIFLILIGAACVNMVGGGSSDYKQVQSQPVNVPPVQVNSAPVQVTALITTITTPEPTIEQIQQISLSGTGQQATNPVNLQAGLSEITLTHSGSKNFIVKLLGTSDSFQEFLTNEIGVYSGSRAVNIPSNGDYLFDVNADGTWTITINQPRTNGPAPSFTPISGIGDYASQIFSLKSGTTVLKMTHTGSRNFIVKLLSEDGELRDLLVNEIGPFDGSKAVMSIAGNYVFDIKADGAWSIS